MSKSSSALLVQVRTASCGAANCVNTFGDEQLAVDLLADKLLFEALKYSVRFRLSLLLCQWCTHTHLLHACQMA